MATFRMRSGRRKSEQNPQGRKTGATQDGLLSVGEFDVIPQASEVPDHSLCPTSLGSFVHRRASFFVTHTLVQNLPNESAQSVGDDADRLLGSKAQDVPTIQCLKDAARGFHGGIGRLVEKTPHLTISLRRSMAVADACALVIAGTGTDPRSEVAGGGKARGGHADLGHDLLRRIDAPSGALLPAAGPGRGTDPTGQPIPGRVE